MQLTNAEEQIMQILWRLQEGAVKDIRNEFPDPKPARNTVSTIIRILEKKGHVDHKTYGNVHVYFPLTKKEDYSKKQLLGLMKNYFNNSFPALASFFAKETDLSVQELEELLEQTKKEIKKSMKNSEE
ncbi:BlaI/MecI/CopY family transcriptional regulator [Alkalitalea saponilacus]|uniref:Predicted transcriptional regulator n=1 Tax=Alkalitalea saponilacus TaxID=889453 RepID=A0A1T5HS07_9BACT|nr:BlaI/MecI/CopY family transcriptional regulator [Alkalitalea saponilacus]ASB50074.1 CopY family transcriptional repressor [Alkalitalea saponilacus]SKC23392.1 Predicted transcriptional regulator [Alkalitalea saponilacus]